MSVGAIFILVMLLSSVRFVPSLIQTYFMSKKKITVVQKRRKKTTLRTM